MRDRGHSAPRARTPLEAMTAPEQTGAGGVRAVVRARPAARALGPCPFRVGPRAILPAHREPRRGTAKPEAGSVAGAEFRAV